MKQPQYTNLDRLPAGGYVPASRTNLRRTFARVRAQFRQSGENPLDPETWAEPHRSKFLKSKPLKD